MTEGRERECWLWNLKKSYLFEVLFSEACPAQKNINTQKYEACLSNRKKLHDAAAFVGQTAQQEVFGRKILFFFPFTKMDAVI